MPRRSQRSSGTVATIVMDGNTLNVVHVYVNCSMKRAAQVFMATLQEDCDPMYSDAKDLMAAALDRYMFIETHNVSIGR